MAKLHIHYITDTRQGLKVGERNQALGVVDALRARYPDAIVLEHDVSEMERLQQIMRFHFGQHVVVGVSENGAKALSALRPRKGDVLVLAGHEVPENLEQARGKIDILAIPGYAGHCPDTFSGADIIRTDGVSNTMTAEKVEAAIADWEEKFSYGKEQPVIVAMLGGRVDGKDFQPGEARAFGKYLVEKAGRSGAYIIATDSPRSHPQDTEDFTEELARSPHGSAFLPFSVKNQNKETPYRAMVGIAAKPRNVIAVTGDSVSMPCEIARVVPPSQLYIYEVSNANEQNRRFVDWMHQGGKANKVAFQKDGFEEHYVAKPSQGVMDAAGQIADGIARKIEAHKQKAVAERFL